MKIAMMSRWNIPCGVSLHAELVGRAWVEMGHDLQVLAPVEWEGYQSDADEPYVERCYRLPKPGRKEDFFTGLPQNRLALPLINSNANQ